MKIKLLPFATACGLWWGFGLFFIIWWVVMFDGATGDPTPLSPLYRGLNYSAQGSIIGLGYGLADGFIGGWILGWLYNLLFEKFRD